MRAQFTTKRRVTMNYKKYLEDQLQTSIEAADHKSVYYALLHLTKELCKEKPANQGTKKIYYISAEFLIGKLLSNNLINLGIYDDIKKLLHENGKSLEEIEEFEPEPSLGNGGLGRLAACFLDSIATLGLPGAGIGLNYHYGLFRQVFENKKQKELKNPWIFQLFLLFVFKNLSEETVMIIQTNSSSRKSKCCYRIKKTSSQASESAISK